MLKNIRISLTAPLLLLLCAAVSSQIPRLIAYQGILTDQRGNPRPDGKYSFSFDLFSDSSGGSSLWNQSESLLVHKGMFGTLLGSKTLLNLPFNQQYWLSVSVDGKELSPRTRLASVAYCLRADTANVAVSANNARIADTAKGIKGDAALNISSLTANGNVDVNGDISLKGKIYTPFSNNDNNSGLDLQGAGTSGHYVVISGKGENSVGYLVLLEGGTWSEKQLRIWFAWNHGVLQSHTGDIALNPYHGNVGIGRYSPHGKLQIHDTTLNGHILNVTNGRKEIWMTTNTGTGSWNPLTSAGDCGIFFVDGLPDSGSLVIAPWANSRRGIRINASGCPAVEIAGTLIADNTSCPSDLRFKTDISPIASALKTINKLQGVFFRWNRKQHPERSFSENRQVGLIAQDVEKVIPEIVTTDREGYKSLSYDKLTVFLVEAIKEQQREIEILKKEIQKMKKEID